jgi:hypothetical protein
VTDTTARRLRLVGGLAVVSFLVWAAQADAALSILVAFTALVTAGLFLVPKAALVVIGVFLFVQPIAVNLAGGEVTPLGLALHRLHEGFAVAGVLRVALFLLWGPIWARMRRWFWLTAAFLAAGVGSALLAHVPLTTMALGAFLAVKFQIFLLLALTIPWTGRDCQRVMTTALWLGPVLFASGVLVLLLPPRMQAVFMTGQQADFTRGDFDVLHGILPHPGVFGWAMAVTGCYAVAALLVERPVWRTTGVGSLGASVLGILGSLRRKPLVGLPLAAVYGVTAFAQGRRRWTVLALFAVIAGGAAWIVTERLEAIYEDSLLFIDPSSPIAPRILLYVTGVEIADAHVPLGAGFGRFGGYASVVDYSPLYDEYGLSGVWSLSRENSDAIADAYWPHIAAETGWLGAAILGALFLLLLRSSTQAALAAQDPVAKALAIGAGLALIEALVESGAGPVFEVSLFAFVLAVPLAITLVRATEPRTEPASAGVDQDDVPLPSPGESLE